MADDALDPNQFRSVPLDPSKFGARSVPLDPSKFNTKPSGPPVDAATESEPISSQARRSVMALGDMANSLGGRVYDNLKFSTVWNGVKELATDWSGRQGAAFQKNVDESFARSDEDRKQGHYADAMAHGFGAIPMVGMPISNAWDAAWQNDYRGVGESIGDLASLEVVPKIYGGVLTKTVPIVRAIAGTPRANPSGVNLHPVQVSDVAQARRDLNIPLEMDTQGNWMARMAKRTLLNRALGREPIVNRLQKVNTASQDAAVNIADQIAPGQDLSSLGNDITQHLASQDAATLDSLSAPRKARADQSRQAESDAINGLGSHLNALGVEQAPEVAGQAIKDATKSPIGTVLDDHTANRKIVDSHLNDIKASNDRADQAYDKWRSVMADTAQPVEVQPATTVPGDIHEVLPGASTTPDQQPQAPGVWSSGTRNFQQDQIPVPAVTKDVMTPVDLESTVKAPWREAYEAASQYPSVAVTDPGYRLLDRLMKMPNSIDAVEAEKINGLLKELAQDAEMPELRNRAEGLARASSGRLQQAIDEAISKAPPEAKQALQEGRRATYQKYQARDLLKELGYKFGTSDFAATGNPVQRLLGSKNDLLSKVLTAYPDLREPIQQAFLRSVGEASNPAVKFNMGIEPHVRGQLFDPNQTQAISSYLRSPSAALMNVAPENIADTIFKPGQVTAARAAVDAIGAQAPDALQAIRRQKLDSMFRDSIQDGTLNGKKLLNDWNNLGEGVQRSLSGPARDSINSHINNLAGAQRSLADLPPVPKLPKNPLRAEIQKFAVTKPLDIVRNFLEHGNDNFLLEAKKALTPELYDGMRRASFEELISRNSSPAVGTSDVPVLNAKRLAAEWKKLSPVQQSEIAGKALPTVNKLLLAVKDADITKLATLNTAIHGGTLDAAAIAALAVTPGWGRIGLAAWLLVPKLASSLLTSEPAVNLLNEGLNLSGNRAATMDWSRRAAKAIKSAASPNPRPLFRPASPSIAPASRTHGTFVASQAQANDKRKYPLQ